MQNGDLAMGCQTGSRAGSDLWTVPSLGRTQGRVPPYGRAMEPDRWERLAESLSLIDDRLDVDMADAVAQGERAQTGLVHRLRASTDLVVQARSITIRGRVDFVGTDVVVLRDGSSEWIVPIRSIDTVEGLASALSWDPRTSAQRVGLASMLRAEAGGVVRMHLGGRVITGEIVRVGHDHLDVAVLDDESRSITIAFEAITCLQRQM